MHLLHQSDFYRMVDFRCHCMECSTTPEEYTRTFNFCFVRKGYFEYRVFRRNLEVHVGRVLISKAGTTHYTHHIANQPDVCSVLYFTNAFVERLREKYPAAAWFFDNPDVQSLLLKCTPEADYFHFMLLNKSAMKLPQLQRDEWALQLVEHVMNTLTNTLPQPIAPSLKRHHLSTVEKAKDYLLQHFDQDVHLQALADHCCVSLFHFARIFKEITGWSPYQYLTSIRLHHARVLMESTEQPVSEIALLCGYSNTEHFSTAYRQRFGVAPSLHRARY
jgi:AraC-like DNA-binding protein